jgi:acyl-CoA synthetase (AMP-forming)/AMP-acid ligase II
MLPSIATQGLSSIATLVDLVEYRAEEHPNDLAYSFIDGDAEVVASLSYAELRREAKRIAASLQARLPAGERVLLTFSAGLEFVAAYFGCLLAGVVPVPALAPRSAGTTGVLRRIVEDAGAKLALTDERCHERCEASLPVPTLPLSRLLLEDLPFVATRVAASDLALLQYTSGSTGQPKGVMVTHGNLLANSRAIARAFGHTRQSRGVIWLPPHHDMGLIGGVIQPLYAGFPVWLMSPFDILQRPLRWLRAVSVFKGTTSGGPNFAYQLCTDRIRDESLSELDLSSWRVAFNGAEVVREGTLREFAQRFGKVGFEARAFTPCYGLAEASLMVTCAPGSQEPVVAAFNGPEVSQGRVRPSRPDAAARVLVSSGQPIADHDVLVVSPETNQVCAEGVLGEIRVRGPSVALGYWGNPDASRETFGTEVEGRGGAFLRTGDFGWRHADEVFVCGRLKDMVVIAGRNYAADDIESSLVGCHEALAGRSSVAFASDDGRSERLVVLHEVSKPRLVTRSELDAAERALRDAVARALDICVHEVVFVAPGALVRTPNGKVRRHHCRELWHRGQLTCLRSQPVNEPARAEP